MLVKSSRNFNSDSEDAFISKEEYISSNSKILTQFFTDSTEIWNKTKGLSINPFLIIAITIFYIYLKLQVL